MRGSYFHLITHHHTIYVRDHPLSCPPGLNSSQSNDSNLISSSIFGFLRRNLDDISLLEKSTQYSSKIKNLIYKSSIYQAIPPSSFRKQPSSMSSSSITTTSDGFLIQNNHKKNRNNPYATNYGGSNSGRIVLTQLSCEILEMISLFSVFTKLPISKITSADRFFHVGVSSPENSPIIQPILEYLPNYLTNEIQWIEHKVVYHQDQEQPYPYHLLVLSMHQPSVNHSIS